MVLVYIITRGPCSNNLQQLTSGSQIASTSGCAQSQTSHTSRKDLDFVWLKFWFIVMKHPSLFLKIPLSAFPSGLSENKIIPSCKISYSCVTFCSKCSKCVSLQTWIFLKLIAMKVEM